MKILVNNTREISNVSAVSERIKAGDSIELDINMDGGDISLEELKTIFTDVKNLTVIRTDLNGEEQSVIFTEYGYLDRIQRRISEETDIITVSLVKASPIDDTVVSKVIN